MKMHFFLIIFLTNMLYYSESETKQKQENIGTILLKMNFKGDVILYEDCLAKKIKKRVKNNVEDEDYVYFEILKTNKNMYYVGVNYSIDGFIESGWVKKNNSAFGIYSKAYAGNLKLFEKPDKTSKVIILSKYSSNLYKVFDCKNKWLLIEVIYKNNKVKRWIEPAMQCDNHYTTCN